jgi:hypothetical protein
MKRARKGKMAEALAGKSAGVQPRLLQGGQRQCLQEHSLYGTQGKEEKVKSGTRQSGPVSSEGKEPTQGPSKLQRRSGGTPGGWRAKRPKTIGPLNYAKAAQEGILLAIVCDVYPEVQVSKEKLTNIEQAVGGLVDGLPKEGFTPRLIDMYLDKWCCHWSMSRRKTRNGGPGCSPCI